MNFNIHCYMYVLASQKHFNRSSFGLAIQLWIIFFDPDRKPLHVPLNIKAELIP